MPPERQNIPCNVGRIDRIVRVALGIALLALIFLPQPVYLGWFGIGFLMTGLVGVCPFYALFGRSPNYRP